jgi:hypothetical protein
MSRWPAWTVPEEPGYHEPEVGRVGQVSHRPVSGDGRHLLTMPDGDWVLVEPTLTTVALAARYGLDRVVSDARHRVLSRVVRRRPSGRTVRLCGQPALLPRDFRAAAACQRPDRRIPGDSPGGR